VSRRGLHRRYGRAKSFEKLSDVSYYIKGPLGGYLAFKPGYGPDGKYNEARKHVGWALHGGGSGRAAYFTTLKALRAFVKKGIRL
jgi:hypothetical protein